jgi:8-oxo-dGTP pyrophosphatase MutT (NUDIX family)
VGGSCEHDAVEEPRRIAAVLVPVFRDAEGHLRMVLIVRADRGLHGGQLALPGGKADDDDESLLATALREAEEEIGLSPSEVEVIAELGSVHSGPTRFDVHPFLARIPAGVQWRPSEEEVVEVLTPLVAELGRPDVGRELLFTSARFPDGLLVDGIPVGEHVLWGMTLRLLDDVVPRLLAGEWAV